MRRATIEAFEAEFHRYRILAEGAAAQLDWPALRTALDPEVNSIAVVMKHLAGNLRSRWTDALTTDGEKPWRDRDREFIDDFADRAALDAWWRDGWAALEAALAPLTDEDLHRTLTIRGEPHSLALALARSLSHTAYHAGQVVQTARAIASRRGQPWRVLTIPRGGSDAFNRARRFDPGGPSPAPAAPAQDLDAVASQFDAALAMLQDCVEKCPAMHWNEKIAKYPFWLVVYHTLCCLDGYLARGEAAWSPRDGSDGGPVFHPDGRADVEEEYPSREFSREEMLAYLALLRPLTRRTLAADTPAMRAEPCGFSWLPLTRGELHLYNMRHVMHHVGQLSASLRRAGVEARWVKMGMPGVPGTR